jgi:hypothetical protein
MATSSSFQVCFYLSQSSFTGVTRERVGATTTTAARALRRRRVWRDLETPIKVILGVGVGRAGKKLGEEQEGGSPTSCCFEREKRRQIQTVRRRRKCRTLIGITCTVKL